MKAKRTVAGPRPPKHSQFEKGQSGNPRGRPKGSRNLAGLLKEALAARVEEDGTGMTKLEAAVKQIADNAAAGDARILQMLLAELRRLEPAAATPPHDCMAVVRSHMEGARERVMAKLGRLRLEHEGSLARGTCPTCGAAQEKTDAGTGA